MLSGSARRPLHQLPGEAEYADGMPLEVVVAVDPGEAQEHGCEHRVAGRRRLVVELLLAGDEPLSVRPA